MPDTTLRFIFAGRRGRLLTGLLLAEFAGAIQSVAYSTVLPIASRDLHGRGLYGATLAAGSLSTILVLACGAGYLARLRPAQTLATATALYLAGVAMTALAPVMMWVLAGSVLRGLAGGLLAALGLTAIGSLYEDAVRARVLGLFAVVWLIPSLAGPAVNAVVAVLLGWRSALAWPAVLVLAARVLVSRDIGLIPQQARTRPTGLTSAAVVLGGLTCTSVLSGLREWWTVPLFSIGLIAALAGALRILRRDLRDHYRTGRAFLGLCGVFFGGSGIVSLAVVDGMGHGVVAGSIAFGAGLIAWSLTGLRSAPVANSSVLGPALVTLGLTAETVAVTGNVLPLAVSGWAVAGLGMGFAYPWLSARAFDDAPVDNTASIATAVAFAEVVGTALGSLLGGGVYSVATGLGGSAPAALGLAFGLLALAAAATTIGSARRTACLQTSRR